MGTINLSIGTYEKKVFDLVKINHILFEECIKKNISYAILLRDWIKECLDQRISVNKVAISINKSEVLRYIEVSSKIKILT
ncbi:hypothetical protein [Aquimarina celericrescens]|uniref:Uncharacterized protein n=1 Tax=Aquimarina celericrescens TaxID=1964542 RepID=A0ABW5AZ63_9FLAO|nr:hypothetical protein [Aquimarina celericrescens]